MKFRLSWIIYFLIFFVPFEVMILKYLPVNDRVYGILLFFVEVLIYVLAGIVLFKFLNSKRIPSGTPIDRPLLIFIGYSLLITIINQAPMLQSFIGLRVLLRYVPLFYVLSFVHMGDHFPRTVFRMIVGIIAIQGSIATFQHYFGINKFWYPRATELEIGGKQFSFKLLNTSFSGGREMGAGIGTFGDSVFLALFLVLSFTILISALQKVNHIDKKTRWFILAVTALAIATLFFTYSRGSVLIALASIPIILFFSGGRKKLIIYFTAGIILASPLILYGVLGNTGQGPGYINPKIKYTDPISNIFAVFTSSYVENTMQFSRGAILTEIGGELVSTFKLLGYSPAQEFALEKAATKLFGSNMPINNLPIINDVYWVAFIIYYGIIGLLIFWFILFRLMKGSMYVFKNTPDPYIRIFALAFIAIVILSIPYSFILRTFVFRAFGFYFWLIAGIVFAEWRRLRQLQKQGALVESPAGT
ncbi:MAG: hypothetical protein ACKOYC_01765 [Bacteroidota bacterium]